MRGAKCGLIDSNDLIGSNDSSVILCVVWRAIYLIQRIQLAQKIPRTNPILCVVQHLFSSPLLTLLELLLVYASLYNQGAEIVRASAERT